MKTTPKESQSTEFKPSWRDEYLKIICAFANTEGGNLIIGVDDKGKPIGIKNSKKLLEDIPNKVRNKLGIIPSVELKKKKNKEIIEVIVKPSTVPISYDGKFYIRSGSTVQELKGNELANFLMRKLGKTWDEIIGEKANLEDIDKETIEKFKDYAIERIPSIVKEKDYKIILEKLNLMEGNRLKRAGVLLFGKNPQRFYPNAVVKIGKFLTQTEILTTDLIEGNLFEQLEKSLEVLRTKYLKAEIKFEGIRRRDILEYPYEALREAIINALIHRDYTGTSNIQIRVYQDKLVIMNEGKLPPEVPVESLKKEHLSRPRNELLARVFYYAGFIEAWGRGTLKIIENCKKQGLPEPDFIEEYGVMKVVFYKDIYTEENLKKMGLNERQIKIIKYIKEHKSVSLSVFKDMIPDVSEKTLYRDLQELVNRGLLKKIGKKKGTKYELL